MAFLHKQRSMLPDHHRAPDSLVPERGALHARLFHLPPVHHNGPFHQVLCILPFPPLADFGVATKTTCLHVQISLRRSDISSLILVPLAPSPEKLNSLQHSHIPNYAYTSFQHTLPTSQTENGRCCCRTLLFHEQPAWRSTPQCSCAALVAPPRPEQRNELQGEEWPRTGIQSCGGPRC